MVINFVVFIKNFSLTVAVIISVMVVLGSVAISIGRYRSPDDQMSSTSSSPNLDRTEHNRIREVSLRSNDTIESII